MSTSGHVNLSSCHVVGDRAILLSSFPYKTDVVASVLPAPSGRGSVTGEQLAQATKVVLNKTISCYLIAQQHCCTMICLMTDGQLEFLGINVVDVATSTTVFHSTDSNFAHFTNLCFDGQNKCFHALLHGERVVLHVVLIGADDALSHYDIDCTSSPNDKHDSCHRGVCDLSYHANNGTAHVLEAFVLCCHLVLNRMISSPFASLTPDESSVTISECISKNFLLV